MTSKHQREKNTFKVNPSIFHRLPFQPRRATRSFFPGRFRSTLSGEGLEFHNLRDYAAGDQPGKIHWKHFAKTGNLLVREDCVESNLRIWALWDISSSMDFGVKREMIEAFHLFLSHLAHNGDNSLGSVVFSDKIHYFQKPVMGSFSLKVRGLIAKLRKNLQGQRKTSLVLACAFVMRFVRRGDIVFIVSDFLSEENLEETLRGLALEQECIPVVIRDVHERLNSKTARVSWKDLESGLVLNGFKTIELDQYDEDFKKILRSLGIDYLWLEAENFSQAIHLIAEWLSQRSKR